MGLEEFHLHLNFRIAYFDGWAHSLGRSLARCPPETVTRFYRRLFVVLLASGVVSLAWLAARTVRDPSDAGPGPLRLGIVEFPASGRPAAQPHFLRGVAALHSFWYEEALEAFQTALGIDANFAMAWWGVAMAYHRPFVPGSDDEAGRRALAHIRDTTVLTARERDYIQALRAWYGSGTAAARARSYAVAMGKVRSAHPDDLEAAAFYALSLLGQAWADEEDLSRQNAAGAVAEEVYRRNPNHPGAAHYIIHSYDSPALASRALPAARHYAGIAPEAPHALHMPSHIFLQLGMWAETTASNEAAWAASEAWVQRKNLGASLRDYHNYHWLIYSCLQQGRHAKAAALVEEFRAMRKDIAPESLHFLNRALAAFVIETRCWARADDLFAPAVFDGTPRTAAPAKSARGLEFCSGEVDRTSVTSGPPPADVPAFIRAFAAAARSAPETDQMLSELRARAGGDNAMPEFWRIRVLEIVAVSSARANAIDAAIQALQEATAIEEELGKPPGPPAAYKPPHELYGEVLLQAGRPAEAAAQFNKNLLLHPNRALSLLGRARAEAALGDKAAALSSYGRLLEIWQQADEDLPELREARDFVKANRG